MQVSAIMSREVISIRPSATILEALRTMEDNFIRHLPVVDDEGKLSGMLSDRDLRQYRLPWLADPRERVDGAHLLERTVEHAMTPKPVFVAPDEELGSAIDAMLHYQIGAVPVLGEDERVVGIVSYVDVLRTLRDGLAP